MGLTAAVKFVSLNRVARSSGLLGVALLLLMQAGCATSRLSPDDPLASFNRASYAFNAGLDRALVKPLALRYQHYTPDMVRRSIGHLLDNLAEPATAVNALLQGKVGEAANTGLRFLINSTAGVLGTMDVATAFGLPLRHEDFGQTLARWGLPDGPYLVLPLLGPSNLRDTVGILPRWYLPDALSSIDEHVIDVARYSLLLLHRRGDLLHLDPLLSEQPDPYLFEQAFYRQYRLDQIYDGAPPDSLGGSLEKGLFED